MQFLSLSEVIDLQKTLIDRFGGMHGIRDKGLLESALAYPKLCYSIQMERDCYNLAASYAYHLILNHSFIDGNKRVGILTMLTFLSLNGIKIDIPKNELYSLAMKIATSEINEKEVVTILKSYALSSKS